MSDFAIFRCTNIGDTENNVPAAEKLLADYGFKDTSSVGVVSFQYNIPNRKTDVPNPDSRGASRPDTGLDAITVTIGLKFNEKITDNNKIGTLAKWALQSQFVRAKFSAGRFGLRNDKKPWMDFSPTLTAGYKIADVVTEDILTFGGEVDVVVTLEFAGRTSELVDSIIAKGG